jgi:hypothetical protein
MRAIYESNVYSELNPTWHEEDSPWKSNQIRKIVEDNKVPHGRICEVGCGTGSILSNLENYFPASTLTGYDISPHAVARAKKRETARTKFYLADVSDIDISGFDLLLLIDVIEHVEDYVSFLKQLKPIGEYKVLHIPLDISVQSVLRLSPIMNLRKSVGHIHYFLKDSALAVLRDCGYSIIDCRYTASRLELPNQALTSRLMYLPRRFTFSLFPDLAVRLLGGYSLLVLAK